MFEKFKKKAVQGTKNVVKDEFTKCLDDVFPTLVGLASLTLMVLSCVPKAKPAVSYLTINNYYL